MCQSDGFWRDHEGNYLGRWAVHAGHPGRIKWFDPFEREISGFDLHPMRRGGQPSALDGHLRRIHDASLDIRRQMKDYIAKVKEYFG